jgi:hypothetical protein
MTSTKVSMPPLSTAVETSHLWITMAIYAWKVSAPGRPDAEKIGSLAELEKAISTGPTFLGPRPQKKLSPAPC